MWHGYKFDRMSERTAVAILRALEAERAAINAQLDKLEALDAGSAHSMEIQALEQQLDNLTGALAGMDGYLVWRNT